jgi:DNA-binding NarL/FixJ family response regulator
LIHLFGRAVTQLIPDVAVLDISMPGLNGIEVARRIKAKDLKVGVIFLTCCTDRKIFDAACDAGVLGYVIKWRLQTDLVPGIHLALSGGHFVSPSVEARPEAWDDSP